MLPTVLRRRCDSYFVCICDFYHEAFHVVSYLGLCSHAYCVLFSIVITSLGEESVGLYASRAFVCLSCMSFFSSLFLFLLVSETAANCDCGISWIFPSIF